MPPNPSRFSWTLFLLGAVLLSCGDAVGPIPPADLRLTGGDGQAARVGSVLASPLEVKALDSSGGPLSGVPVRWEVVSGEGSLEVIEAVSDAQGISRARWTLGTGAGEQSARARVDGVSPAVFRATAEAGPPAEVQEAGGGDQEGEVGLELPLPLEVRVTDEHGNLVAGARVEWSPVEGEGSVEPDVSETDGEGTASSRWTLGTKAGSEHAVQAGVAEVEPVRFRAEARAGPPDRVVVSPDSLMLAVGESAQLTSAVEDRFGNPVPDPLVTWGSELPAVAEVDDAGVVAARAPGPVRVRAAVEEEEGEAAVTVMAASDPVVETVSPGVLTPGATATLTGSGFSPVADWNRVEVDGVETEVRLASAGELVVDLPAGTDLPCRGTRNVPVSVTVPDRTGSREHPLAVARQLSLDVEESRVATTLEASRCNELTETSGDPVYIVTVFNTSQAPGDLAWFRWRGEGMGEGGAASPAPFLDPAPPGTSFTPGPSALSDSPDASPSSPDDLHTRILERGRELHRRLDHSARLFDVDPAPPAPSSPPDVGDARTVRFPDVWDLCDGSTDIETRVVYSGPRAVVLEDTAAPRAGRMDARLRELGEELEESMFPILEEYFGDPLARDEALGGSGQIFMVFTPEVNDLGGIAGFVSSGDLHRRTVCPASNERGIFYARVPASFDEEESWLWQIRSTVIHEVKHITSIGERLSRNAQVLEEVWLEESTARISEELWAREIFGYAQRGNTGYAESIGCEYTCFGRPMAMRKHFGAAYIYYWSPHVLTPVGRSFPGDATFYGSGWLLTRWAADHYGGGEARFFRALTQETERSGVENLTARTGRSFTELLGTWSLSLYADGRIDGDRPELQHPSWDLRDVFAGLHRNFPDFFPAEFPLRGWGLEYGDFDEGVYVVRGGSAGFFSLGGTAGGPQLLELRGEHGGAPPSTLRMAIVRVR